jgi:hypothetical protein
VSAPEQDFAGESESGTQHWRSVVLFGRNVASYKFALAKSLLELGQAGHEKITLEELAVPFSRHVCEHIARADRQGTFASSRFLDACRFYNAGRIGDDELRTATATLGFNNVIDAFHIVGAGEVPTRFFTDERRLATGGIRLTDALLNLATGQGAAADLGGEAEARWRLVEEAWDARAYNRQVIVLYDAPHELLVPALLGRRRPITEVRPALSGYQKGHCFFCFRPIAVVPGPHGDNADVDHFFPYVLNARGFPIDLDQVWNLELACVTCNRGPAGKGAQLPAVRYLPRLHRRNEYLIGSHHPLRETLIAQTGNTSDERRNFLREVMRSCQELASRASWTAQDEQQPLF